MKSFLPLLIVVLVLSQRTTAFALTSPSVPRNAVVSRRPSRTTTSVSASSREEEIAKLEEQLRKLREEEADGSSSASSTATRDDATLNSEIDAVERRILEKVQGKDMILSEQELYDGNIVKEESSEGGNMVQTILTAVAAIVVLGIFSQIPMGDEGLSKYSAQAGPTVSRTIDLGDLNTDTPSP